MPAARAGQRSSPRASSCRPGSPIATCRGPGSTRGSTTRPTPHTIVVSGPAGAGKSALVAAFLEPARRAAARGSRSTTTTTIRRASGRTSRTRSTVSSPASRARPPRRRRSRAAVPAQRPRARRRGNEPQLPRPRRRAGARARRRARRRCRASPTRCRARFASCSSAAASRRYRCTGCGCRPTCSRSPARDLRFSLPEAIALFGDTANRAAVTARLEQTEGWARGPRARARRAAAGRARARRARVPLRRSRRTAARRRAALPHGDRVSPAPQRRGVRAGDRTDRRRRPAAPPRTRARVRRRRSRRLGRLRHAAAAPRDVAGRAPRNRSGARRRRVRRRRPLVRGARGTGDRDRAVARRGPRARRAAVPAPRDRRPRGREPHAACASGPRASTRRPRPGSPALLLDLAVACAIVGDDPAARDATDRADNLLRAAPDPMSEFRSTLLHARLALGAGDVESQVVALQAGRDLLRAEPALVQASLHELPLARQLHPWLALGHSGSSDRSTGASRSTPARTRRPNGSADRVLVWGVEAVDRPRGGSPRRGPDAGVPSAATRRKRPSSTASPAWPAAQVLAALTRERAGVDAAQRAFEALIERHQRARRQRVLGCRPRRPGARCSAHAATRPARSTQLSRIPRGDASSTHSVAQSWIDQATALTYLRIGEVHAAREVLGAARRAGRPRPWSPR